MNEARLYVANQQAAVTAVKKLESLSTEELAFAVLAALKGVRYPENTLPKNMDTSREGLLDFLAGIAAMAAASPAD